MPLLAAVTDTLIVHVLLAATPPEKVMKVAPATGENVGDRHPADVVAAGVAATLIWAGEVGSVSVKLTPVTAVLLEFVIAMDKVEVLPPVIETGLKDFVMLSGDVMEAKRAWAE